MKSKNICKFISEPSFEKLEIHNFIYETEATAMTETKTLTTNRLFLFKSGTGQIMFNSAETAFVPGSLVFGFSGETFRVSPKEPTEYMYISFSGTRADSLFERFAVTRSNRHYKGFEGLIPLWLDSVSHASDINIDLAAESILLYTLSRLEVKNDEQSGLVKRIIEITEDNFSDPELSIAGIAEMLNYNSKYLSHIFKKHMVIGYSQYLRNYRIKYAVSLFGFGIDSVRNVAFLSGFSDPLYFSSVFKKLVGISPKEYKAKIRESADEAEMSDAEK